MNIKSLVAKSLKKVTGFDIQSYLYHRKNHIVFIPSYFCNYKCPYCNVWDRDGKFKPVDVEEWVSFFKYLKPSIVDVTGGEPFYYPGFEYLMLVMSEKHSVSVTTNFSWEISDFELIVDIFTSMTISYHPHRVSIDDLVLKIRELKKYRTKPIGCNIVAYPDQLDNLPEYIRKLQEEGVHVNIDPYIMEDFTYSEEEVEKVNFARKLAGMENLRKMGYDKEDDGKPKLCTAGMKHIIVVPDGSAFACMCGYFAHPDLYQLGNVFDDDWDFSKLKRVCITSCSCGCDLDWVKFEYMGDK